MFGWFKRKGGTPPQQDENRKTSVPPPQDENRKLIEASFDLADQLGELMERYPGVIMDSKVLPLPKVFMKAALQHVWRALDDESQRAAIEVAFLHLANFQDGLGDRPVNIMLSADADPRKVSDALGAALPWMDKSMKKMESLKAELDAFKRSPWA
jgi:hypothetical protein